MYKKHEYSMIRGVDIDDAPFDWVDELHEQRVEFQTAVRFAQERHPVEV